MNKTFRLIHESGDEVHLKVDDRFACETANQLQGQAAKV